MTTIYDLLTDAKKRITPISPTASLDAQLLLAEVLGCNRAHIIAYPEEIVPPEQAAQIETMVARRADGEPIAYILGRRAFYDREFIVTPAVLVPRPETEHLLEIALKFVRARHAVPQQTTAVDIGTGSGALAVTLAANAPQATVYATDISPDALKIAQLNAEKNAAKVTFFQGDLLQPLIDQNIQVDLIMANLPYITTGDMQHLAVSKHEPHLALDGGDDGLDLLRRLLAQAPSVIQPGGMILLEIGTEQGAATQQLAQDMQTPRQVTVHKDYAGHDRVVEIKF